MFKSKKILEKEEEFVKLNAELDLETKDLMEQVDQVMVRIFIYEFNENVE